MTDWNRTARPGRNWGRWIGLLLVISLGWAGCKWSPWAPIVPAPIRPHDAVDRPWSEAAREAVEASRFVGLAPPDPRFSQALSSLPDLFPGVGLELKLAEITLIQPETSSTTAPGRWNYGTEDQVSSLGTIPEVPNFLEMHTVLRDAMTSALAQNPTAQPDRPVAPEVARLVEAHYREPSLQALHILAKIPPPYSRQELAAMARAAVSVALETYDPLELLGPWEARAWALCAAAEAADPSKAILPDTVLLAESLGYAPEAMKMAENLLPDSMVRLKVLRQFEELSRRAPVAPLSPMDRSVILYASESVEALHLPWPTSILPQVSETGGVAALLCSQARRTTGTEQTNAAATLFAFETEALHAGSEGTTRPVALGLEELLRSGRSGGGLTGRFALGENEDDAPLAPIMPGGLHLLPRRAAAFGSLYLIGGALTRGSDLSMQFDLVLGSAPLDTTSGLLGRAVRALTVEPPPSADEENQLWRRFEVLLEEGGLPTVRPQQLGRLSTLPRRYREIPPTRPRNRREIRTILLERPIRQLSRARALIAAQSVPPTLDNLPFRLAHAVLNHQLDTARVLIGDSSLQATTAMDLLSELLQMGLLRADQLQDLVPAIRQKIQNDPARLSQLGNLLQRLSMPKESLEALQQAHAIALAEDHQEVISVLREQVLWQSLLTSSTSEVVTYRRQLPLSPGRNSSVVDQMIDHLEEVPLPAWAFKDYGNQIPEGPFAQTSATQATAAVLRAREETSAALPIWLGALPYLAPEFYQEATVPALTRTLQDRPDLAVAVSQLVRRRWLMPVINRLEEQGQFQTIQTLISQSVGRTSEPQIATAARLIALVATHDSTTAAEELLLRNAARFAGNSDIPPILLLCSQSADPRSLDLAHRLSGSDPIVVALQGLSHAVRERSKSTTGSQALLSSSQTQLSEYKAWLEDPLYGIPKTLQTAGLKPSEGTFLVGLAALHGDHRELSADAFRAVILMFDTEFESPVHQAATRLLQEITRP